MACEGAGGWVIVSQARQENFSRTCWMTFHCRGITSSVSVMSSPILRKVPPQHGQADGARIDDPFAWQMVGQAAGAPARRRANDATVTISGRPRSRLGLRRVRFQIGKLEFKLIEQAATLRRLAEAFVP